jgi:FHS family glucose/mannose:H+ symporter-like MFS transporter
VPVSDRFPLATASRDSTLPMLSTPPRRVKKWQIKAALFLNFLVLAVLLNSVGAVSLHVQRAYGVPESAAATFAVYKSAGIVAASIGAWLFLQRIGYRRAMMLSLFALTIVCLVAPLWPGLGTLRVLFVIAGASFATIKVAVYATVGLVAEDPREHASTMSFLEAFFPVGIVAGNFLFGAFTDNADPHSTHWLDVFYFLGSLSGAAALLLLSVPFDTPPPAPLPGAISRTFNWRGPGLLLFGACVFLYVMIEQSALNWLPTFNTRVLHLAPRLGIQLASGLTIAVVLGRLVSGLLLRRIAWFPVLVTSLIMAAALLLVALWGIDRPSADLVIVGVPAVALLLPIVGFFLAPIYPAINSAVLTNVPRQGHAAVSSWGVMVSAAGSSIGTVIVGHLFQSYGGLPALSSALLPMAALVVCLWLFRRRLALPLVSAG